VREKWFEFSNVCSACVAQLLNCDNLEAERCCGVHRQNEDQQCTSASLAATAAAAAAAPAAVNLCTFTTCTCASCCRDQSSFFEDKGIEPRLRSKLDDFRDSGYDRGHMVCVWGGCKVLGFCI
jgi:DNA/RNA endonuclease G (NUC1)